MTFSLLLTETVSAAAAATEYYYSRILNIVESLSGACMSIDWLISNQLMYRSELIKII